MRKHICYLASGAGRRFGESGENKLLYPLAGKALYLHGLERLADIVEKRDDCTLTVISRYGEIREQAEKMGIHAIDSPESEKGLSYTIRAAVTHLQTAPDTDFAVFVVADQPYWTETSFLRLLDTATPDTQTARLCYGVRQGNPVLFSLRLRDALLSLEGDHGGRALCETYGCIHVQAGSPQELWDIDTKQDLTKTI